jgi:hypothetical protein
MKVNSVDSSDSVHRYREMLYCRREEEKAIRRREEMRLDYERRRAESIRQARSVGSDKGQNVDVYT